MGLGEHGVSEGVQRRLGLELRGLAVDDVVQEEHPICFGHSGYFLRTKALLRSKDHQLLSLLRRCLFLRFVAAVSGIAGGS